MERKSIDNFYINKAILKNIFRLHSKQILTIQKPTSIRLISLCYYGFTPNQRFFIGWATVWRQNVREQEQMRRLIVDPHSPGKLRCNGPLSNMPQFYEAFGVKQNNGMWRNENEQAKIW